MMDICVTLRDRLGGAPVPVEIELQGGSRWVAWRADRDRTNHAPLAMSSDLEILFRALAQVVL